MSGMSKIPPRKRKTAGKSLRAICRRLKLPFRKTKRADPTPNQTERAGE